jgi:hypothetical protein
VNSEISVMTYISQALDRIRPPKREQVQFLFSSLGSVDPTRGEEGADSSNTICILKPHLPVDSAGCAQQPRLGNKK